MVVMVVMMMVVMMVVMMMAFKVMLVGFCTQALFQPHLVKVQSQSSRNVFNVEKNRWYEYGNNLRKYDMPLWARNSGS